MLFEESAAVQYKASLLGEPSYVSIAEANRRSETYRNVPEYDAYERSWEYYVSKLGRRKAGRSDKRS